MKIVLPILIALLSLGITSTALAKKPADRGPDKSEMKENGHANDHHMEQGKATGTENISDKKAIHETYKAAKTAAMKQFAIDKKQAKQLKGEEREAAMQEAVERKNAAIAQAKEVKKQALQNLDAKMKNHDDDDSLSDDEKEARGQGHGKKDKDKSKNRDRDDDDND